MKRSALSLLLCLSLLAALAPAALAGSFADVPPESYYAGAVDWALERGVTTGVDADSFAPDLPCTRGEVVTFLWRAMGEPPATEQEFSFTDLDQDWYREAVAWAVENQVTTGAGGDLFAPDAPCTVEQILTFLHRALFGPDAVLSGPGWSSAALQWAEELDLWAHMDAAPDAPCTRAMTVTFLCRALAAEEAQQPPDPEAPASLRDVFGQVLPVWVDGEELHGLFYGGQAYVSAAELEPLWPWFRWQCDGLAWTFTGEAPTPRSEPFTLPCVPPVEPDGAAALWFPGQVQECWLPLDLLCDSLSLRLLWDWDWLQAFVSTVPRTDLASLSGKKIPVIMYHAVSDNTWGIEGLFVSPSDMKAQIKYLLRNGYDPIFFSDLAHIEDYDHPVLLTFDDGYDDNYTQLYPILRECGAKATIFVISGALNGTHFMSPAQAREMAMSGLVDIQSHTVDHYELNTLTAAEQDYQLSQSRLDLARVTGKIPYVLAYPNGSCNKTTKTVGAKYYDFGVYKDGGLWSPGADSFGVTRSRVNRSTSLSAFAALLP